MKITNNHIFRERYRKKKTLFYFDFITKRNLNDILETTSFLFFNNNKEKVYFCLIATKAK